MILPRVGSEATCLAFPQGQVCESAGGQVPKECCELSGGTPCKWNLPPHLFPAFLAHQLSEPAHEGFTVRPSNEPGLEAAGLRTSSSLSPAQTRHLEPSLSSHSGMLHVIFLPLGFPTSDAWSLVIQRVSLFFW